MIIMKKTAFFLWMSLLSAAVCAQTAIGTSNELLSMSMNGHYYLTNDIEVDAWTPLGVFSGTLDGRGYCIRIVKGLPDENGYGGLFAVAEGAVLRNLIVGGSFSDASTACGSLAGRAINTRIENCETEAAITTRTPSAVLGGLVGVMVGGCMYNCSSNASLEGVIMGGLVGSVLDNAVIQNCYSSTSFVVVRDETEAGYLAHDNAGILENNYVRMIEEGWYIASIGQLCMMFGAKGILTNRNDGLIANWRKGYYATSTFFRVARIIGLDSYNKMYSLGFNTFNSYTGGMIPFVHDISGVGYNIGDIVYVGGVKSFVFYIHDDGYGGWVTPIDDYVTHALLTSTDNDALNGYYLTGGSYINALEVDYAQGHDGKLAHGGTVNTIPDFYHGSTGKFNTYTLREQDHDPTHQINNLYYGGLPATPHVKQLAYQNTGTLKHCFFPVSDDVTNLVEEGTTERCTQYESVLPPYQYGEYGPWLYADGADRGIALVDSLNAWVAQQDVTDFCTWSVPGTPDVNANLPIHRYGFHNGSSEVNTAVQLALHGREQALRHADLNALPTAYQSDNATLAYYGNKEEIHADNITVPWDAPLFITEEASLKGDYQLEAHVAITFDNSDGSDFGGQPYDWHSFSTPLADAPVGIDYDSYQAGGPTSSPSEVSFNDEEGYFPLNTPYTSWDFYCYDEPNMGWPNFKRYTGDHYHNLSGDPIPYANEAVLIPGKGYLWAIDKKTTLQASGQLNNGPVELDLTRQGYRYAGYNLVGNPYHAYLDFDAFCSDNGEVLDQQAYVLLDADKKGYVTYCPGASDNPDYAPRYLHPHQGFFVQAKTDHSKVRFDPDQTVVTPLSDFRKGDALARNGMGTPSANHPETPNVNHLRTPGAGVKKNHPLLSLSVTAPDGTRDYAAVEFDQNREGGVKKMEGLHAGDGVLSIGHQGEAYSILLLEKVPCQVPVRLSALSDGVYTLQWKVLHTDLEYLHLIDHLTGTEVDALQNDHYTFTAHADDYASRFALVLDSTGVEEETADSEGEFAFLNGLDCVVTGTGMLELVDLLGRTLLKTTLNDAQTTIRLPETARGVKVLRLTQPHGVRTQKILLP